MTDVIRLPRWSARPVAGRAVRAVPVPQSVPEVAAALDVPAEVVARAAFVRVVGLLTGEELACGETWRDLVRACADGVSVFASEVEAVFGADDAAPLAVRSADGELVLGFDTEVFDGEHVERIGGYLVAALDAICADADARYDGVDLLSEAERRHQLFERNGPVRELPDARFHELFAARAKEHPDAVAAVCRDEVWTYSDLDRASNRVAHALLGAGLGREGVVAIATERGLAWMASIIGVFKAGGVYLPVEPDWPAPRVASLLEVAGARIVLTEPGGHPAAPDGLVAADLVGDEQLPDGDPGIAVRPEDAAYIYFTSGSTGLPKGATCEHLGMLNHLYAKIDDLRITGEDVIVQSTQSSFDISLWQLIAALLLGARTVVVPKQEALDVPRFLDLIVEHDATVVQVVPSYLDLILDHCQGRPRELGRLREVSVTGEAIGRPLIARWFAAFPNVRLINAYGATEVSDDTTHEVMSAPPPDDTVPVGLPLNNVQVSVLGPGDTLVPLGAPGEIVFSGICVGRGYINDPARTALAFSTDPHRPGTRMYRTGDFGRWLPGGKLGFHGRRDEQVKIHGIRIELGEVESRLQEHPRVRGGAVVTVPVPAAGKELVAFYTVDDAGAELPPEALREYLVGVLPAGYVPARLYQIGSLPLTANGKVDKRALIQRAVDELPRIVESGDLPVTDTEKRIARAWAAVLDLPEGRIGRGDRFFELGGSSLGALRMVAALDGLVALDEVIKDPTLHDLAAIAAGATDGTAATDTADGAAGIAGPAVPAVEDGAR